MLFLDKITKNFDQASSSYDRVAIVQKKAAQFLTNQIHQKNLWHKPTVLDVGTGTGYMPEFLLSFYPNADYYFNDISLGMLLVCQKKFAQHKIHMIHTDMDAIKGCTYDLVTSNFSLQWSSHIHQTINHLYSLTRGTLAFSLLLEGTFQEWDYLLDPNGQDELLNYPSFDYIQKICHDQKNLESFDYWMIDYPLYFENPLIFIRYLKSLGATASRKSFDLYHLKNCIKRNEPLKLCYKVFFAILKKT